jgi:molecular chaperone GrpE
MEPKDVIDPDAEGTPNADDAPDAFPADVEELNAGQFAELKQQAAQAAGYRDQLLRTAADLENFKKRATRERQEAIKFANEALLEKLLPILDNFEMALTAASSPNTSVASLQSGISMIFQQLKAAMNDAGLQEIDAAGKAFDPNLHEALSQQETAEVPEGQVVQQLRKGYRLRDRLLRPASVVVARKPAG